MAYLSVSTLRCTNRVFLARGWLTKSYSDIGTHTHTYLLSRLFVDISLTQAKNIDFLSFAAGGYRVNISSVLVIKTGCFFDRRLQWSHAGSLWPMYTPHASTMCPCGAPWEKLCVSLFSRPRIRHGPGVPSPPRSAKAPRGRIPPRLSVSRTVEPSLDFPVWGLTQDAGSVRSLPMEVI